MIVNVMFSAEMVEPNFGEKGGWSREQMRLRRWEIPSKKWADYLLQYNVFLQWSPYNPYLK